MAVTTKESAYIAGQGRCIVCGGPQENNLDIFELSTGCNAPRKPRLPVCSGHLKADREGVVRQVNDTLWQHEAIWEFLPGVNLVRASEEAYYL